MNYEEVARLKTTFTSDTSPLRRGFRVADGYIKAFTAKWAGGLNVPVGLDLDELQRDTKAVAAALAPLRRQSVKIRAELAGVKRLIAELAGARAVADSLDGDQITIPVETRGVATAGAQLFALHKTVEVLHRRSRFRFTANIDKNLSVLLPKALGDSLAVLQSFKTTAAAVHAIAIPTLIGGFGALATVVTGFAGHVAALAIELGKGLGGAIGTVAGAAGLGAAALGGFAFAVNKTLNYAFDLTSILGTTTSNIRYLADIIPAMQAKVKEATKGTAEWTAASRALAVAQQDMRFQQEKLIALGALATQNILKMRTAAQEAQLTMISFGGAIGNRIAPAITAMINQGLRMFPAYRGIVIDTFGKMADAAQSFFQNVLTRGQQLKSFNTIFAGIAASGVPALRAVANAAAALMNILAAIVPDSVRMVKTIQNLAIAARQWTASAAGQAKIAEVWGGMVQRAGQLWHIVRDLSIGLWGVAKALSATAGGPAIRGLTDMAARFRELMKAGGQGRAAIKGFMTDVRPILAAAAGVVGTLVKEFFRVIGAIAGVKSGAKGINPLVDVLHHVQAAIRPIGNLIITNFVRLAPLVGPLIENVAKLASVFLQSIPPLEIFIGLLNRFFNWFTKLDPTIQRMIAGFASWLIVINKVTGGGIGRLIGMVGGLTAGLVGLTGPIGAVIVAAGALAVAGVALYKNWGNLEKLFGGGLGPALEKIKNAVTNAGRSIIQWAKNTWPKVKQFATTAIQAIISKAKEIWRQVQPGVKAFQQGIKTIAAALQGAGGKTNQFKGILSTLGNIAKTVGGWLQKVFVGAVNLLGKVMKAAAPIIANYIKGFKAMAPILKPLGALIKGLLIGAFKALWPVIKLVAKVVGGALFIALKASSAIFRKFGEAVGWVGTKLKPFSPLIEKIGKVVGFVFATVVVGAIGKVLQIGGKLVTWGVKYLPGAFGKAVNAVKGLMSFFGKLLATARKIFDGVQSVVRGAVSWIIARWKTLQSGIQSVMSAIGQKLGGFGTTLKNILGRINLYGIGTSILQGLINGIVDRIPGLRAVLERLSGKMPDWMRTALNIKSPSKKMEKMVGIPTGMGVVKGMDKTARFVKRSAANLAGSAVVGGRSGIGGYVPSARAAGPGSAIMSGSAPIHVTVNINGANTSNPRKTAQDFEREFERVLDNLSRNRK